MNDGGLQVSASLALDDGILFSGFSESLDQNQRSGIPMKVT